MDRINMASFIQSELYYEGRLDYCAKGCIIRGDISCVVLCDECKYYKLENISYMIGKWA